MMAKVTTAKPHRDKLFALLENNKLPDIEKPRLEEQLEKYNEWVSFLDSIDLEGDELLKSMVSSLNKYKKSVEYDLIFCSENDFLYRQKGQLKLDNTILEEFLPRLFDVRLIPGLARYKGLSCGPRSSFAGLSFNAPLVELSNGGAYIKKKDQDFSITRKHKLYIEYEGDTLDKFCEEFHVSYFATEIKTNLDKTMFQEAAATAAELKRATSSSRYILLCEWLDMKPISTKFTAIDEVVILRRSKRLPSNIRSTFSSYKGRQQARENFENFLDENPISLHAIQRFVWHLNENFPDIEHSSEDIVLERGYF